jgi:hypothetical protein
MKKISITVKATITARAIAFFPLSFTALVVEGNMS